MSPVLFVFDATDTEGEPLPPEIVSPYATVGELVPRIWSRTTANLARDGILLIEQELSRDHAGAIGPANSCYTVIDHNKVIAARYRLTEREFEAESICYLVCERAGIQNPSAAYLSDYLQRNEFIPAISFDAVLKAAGMIEQMGKRKLSPRKQPD